MIQGEATVLAGVRQQHRNKHTPPAWMSVCVSRETEYNPLTIMLLIDTSGFISAHCTKVSFCNIYVTLYTSTEQTRHL